MCSYSFDAAENDLNTVFNGNFVVREEGGTFRTTSIPGNFMVC